MSSHANPLFPPSPGRPAARCVTGWERARRCCLLPLLSSFSTLPTDGLLRASEGLQGIKSRKVVLVSLRPAVALRGPRACVRGGDTAAVGSIPPVGSPIRQGS